MLGLGLNLNRYRPRLSSGAASTDFRIVVKTDNAGVSNNDQFNFTGAEGDYDVEVYDQTGTTLLETITGLSDAATITIAAGPGTYELRVFSAATNGFNRIQFNDGGDKLKLLEIRNWGDGYALGQPDQSNAFFGCANLELTGNDCELVNSTVTDGSNMFRDCDLTSLPSGMTLSALTDGFQMFRDCDLTSLPSGMTLSALTDGALMFRDCDLTSLPSGMTLSALTDGRQMFRDCDLTSLPSGMTLSALTDGAVMFLNCDLTSLPSGMTLSALTDGFQMFLNCTINTSSYDQLLINTEGAPPQSNVNFDAGNSQYTAGGAAEAARTSLATTYNWTITDGGPA